MKHDNVNYFAVGLFVLVVLTGFLVTLGMLTGRTGPSDEYFSVYDNVAGIKYGTLVNYEGYHVGQVEKVEPTFDAGATRYKVTFSVGRRADGTRWNIPDDSIARVMTYGLLSVVSLDIQQGSSSSYYRPGDEIRGAGQQDLFLALADLAANLSALANEGVRPLLENINNSVGVVTAAAQNSIPEILNQIESVAKKLNSSAEQVSLLFDKDNRMRVEGLMQQLDGSLDKLNKLLEESTGIVVDNKADIEQSIKALRLSLQVASEHIEEITFNLETTSRNMTELSRQLRQNPALLLGSEPPKETMPQKK